jgi:hypothetical protein
VFHENFMIISVSPTGHMSNEDDVTLSKIPLDACHFKLVYSYLLSINACVLYTIKQIIDQKFQILYLKHPRQRSYLFFKMVLYLHKLYLKSSACRTLIFINWHLGF